MNKPYKDVFASETERQDFLLHILDKFQETTREKLTAIYARLESELNNAGQTLGISFHRTLLGELRSSELEEDISALANSGFIYAERPGTYNIKLVS